METHSNRSTLSFIGIILILLPGLVFLLVDFLNNPGQTNPFIMLFILIPGGFIGLIGLVIYLVVGEGLKTKILTVLACVVFYVLLLPVLWGVNSLRERIYIDNHQAKLEIIAQKLLADEISVEEANEKLKSEKSILMVYCLPKERDYVFFLLGGIIDNCYGLSYSSTGKRPIQNCCGDIIKWKKIKKNWYRWGTT